METSDSESCFYNRDNELITKVSAMPVKSPVRSIDGSGVGEATLESELDTRG